MTSDFLTACALCMQPFGHNTNIVTRSRTLYKCPFCDEEVVSNEITINNHMKIHAETNPQCDICAEICKDKDHKEKHEEVCKSRSKRFHASVTVTPGPKRSRPSDLLDADAICTLCDFTTYESDELKRHMRDTHNFLNASTSPPKKKADQSKEIIGDAAMETKESDIFTPEVDKKPQVA